MSNEDRRSGQIQGQIIATDGTFPEKILQGDEAIRKAAVSNATLNAPGELKAAEEKLVQAKEAA